MEGLIHQTKESGPFSVGTGKTLKDIKQGDNKIKNEVGTYHSADSLENGLEKDWGQGDQLDDTRRIIINYNRGLARVRCWWERREGHECEKFRNWN